MRKIWPLLLFLLCASSAVPLHAQTIDDGCMILARDLFTGVVYSHDSWDQYWEGTRKRTNGNLGTVSTQTAALYADYGVTNDLNFIATVPYVRTHASRGVLQGMKGYQDLGLAAKYKFLETPFTSHGSLKAIAVVSGAIPLSDYTPDYQPLALGSGSKRIAGRLTLNFQSLSGWFVNGSASYTWRDKVTLDRPYYYTDGQLFLTDEVAMPEVFDYTVGTGYLDQKLMASVSYWQQSTQGGGDIRRQDMPFVSNRMNFSRVSAMVLWHVPKLERLQIQAGYSYVLEGRNVGQASTVTTGLLYTFGFGAR